MNIDIVNKQVANKLGIKEAKVAHVNKFYWHTIKEHLYRFDARPVNIESVCVIYPTHYSVKKAIKLYIKKIRHTRISKRYKEGSLIREGIIESYKKLLRGFWLIRKTNQYTN